MQLKPKEIHIWSKNLAVNSHEEQELKALLSADERKRSARFLFPEHQRRFIAARASLRQLLSYYLKTPPEDIRFTYQEHGKPLLPDNLLGLQFNVAHSHDLAVFAFTLHHAIGIDIEKIQESYNPAVAKRYFSVQENADLLSLPKTEQATGFYRLWARKEAVIKAIGKGLRVPLASFSVAVAEINETIVLEHETWTLMSISIDPGYQSALASNQTIDSISYWKLESQK